MNIYLFMRHRLSSRLYQLYCYGIYLMVSLFFFASSLIITSNHRIAFNLIVIAWGWVSWTFFEYILHRYWMHKKTRTEEKNDFANHQYHHTHPTELRVLGYHRCIILLGMILLGVISYRLNNYFSFLEGFYTGFAAYTFMHLLLHRRWAHRIFPRLVENHIYHHCKFPNRCFGVTTIGWDMVFGTRAPKNAKISEKVRQFYFGNHG